MVQANHDDAIASGSSLHRLLAPRSIAFVGGAIAEMAITRCLEAGFDGAIYPVHPSRESIAGYRAYSNVASLPEVPDAAYVGVNRSQTIDIVRALAQRGAGGCVCYAAGFAEIGEAGDPYQDRLIEAAAQMPLIGPNCFGFINYLNHCALWPYLFGGSHVEHGVALISQSGNIAMNLTMNQRSVRFTHVIGTGNQAVLGPADYLQALLEDDRVRAVGMYLEGLDDIAGFAKVAQRALAQGVPIVVMKVGRTPAAAEQAQSHTSSLTGSDILYDALFDRLGVIRVDSLNRLLETLKLFDISGPLPGRNIMTLSCSGGEAAILSDLCDKYRLNTPAFSERQTSDLNAQFPDYVTVSNPFDYNTSVWGDREAMQRCFTTAMSGAHDAAVLIYDHPTVVADEVDEWTAALDAFVAASQATGIRAFVASTVSELLPDSVRERLIQAGVTPLQGLDDALFGLAVAARYQEQRQTRAAITLPRPAAAPRCTDYCATVLDEWESKRLIAEFGLSVPKGRVVGVAELEQAAVEIGFPVALKACGADFVHKSELGAVALGLCSALEVRSAAQRIRASIDVHGFAANRFLVEAMSEAGIAELIVGIKRDAQFGLALVIGSGGIFVELLGDSVSLLLPTDRNMVEQALASLRVAKLLKGFRGRPPGDVPAAVSAILNIAALAEANWQRLDELDVNPLIVLPEGQGVIAADALIRFSESQIPVRRSFCHES